MIHICFCSCAFDFSSPCAPYPARFGPYCSLVGLILGRAKVHPNNGNNMDKIIRCQIFYTEKRTADEDEVGI